MSRNHRLDEQAVPYPAEAYRGWRGVAGRKVLPLSVSIPRHGISVSNLSGQCPRRIPQRRTQESVLRVSAQGDQGKAVVAGLEIYESLFQSLDKEATHCGTGVRLMKDGVHVVSRTLLAEGGVALQAAKEIGPTSGNLLAGLPQGPFVMAGGGIIPEAWMKRLMTVSARMMKMYPGGGDLTDEQVGKLAELSAKSLKGLHSMAMVLGAGQAVRLSTGTP